MRLKAFRDPTLRGAMAQVRSTLGDDALILATRRVAGGVEVTAALDLEESAPPARHEPSAAARPAFEPAWTRTAVAGDGEAGEQARLAQLDWHRVPVALARQLRAGPLTFALSLALKFSPLDLTAHAGPILLVGPPGAGKTLTTARLATRLVLAGVRPLVICADGARAGAAEQLAAFTRLLGVPLIEAHDPAAAAAAASAHAARVPVLIDMPGGDPFRAAEADALAAAANAATASASGASASGASASSANVNGARGSGARIVVVLASGLDPAEAEDLAGAYAALGARQMVATRLDVGRRLGGILSAAAAGLSLVELGIGPGAADGLVPATADLLARRLLAPLPPHRPLPSRRQERSA